MKKIFIVPVFLLMALMTSCGPKPAEELDDPVGADDTVDYSTPALKLVTKNGSSEEKGKSKLLISDEDVRYGVKPGVPSEVEFLVVQEDGTAFPENVKTSFKIESGEVTVNGNVVTFAAKPNNTVKVTVTAEDKTSTVSFTTKYDIETGYVRTYDKNNDPWDSNYVIEYSPDGKNFTTIKENMGEPSLYCFDEYGDIYYSFPTEGFPGYTIEKYSVDKKESENVLQDRSFYALSYDYDNSTLYYLYSDSEYIMHIKNGEINKRYIISGLQSNGVEPKKIVVNDEDIYIWYTSWYKDKNDTNILYKYTMNISDKEIKLENEQKYAFPANVKTSDGGNVTINDMVIIDDDIYMAVGMGQSIFNEGSIILDSVKYNIDSRGCMLKFNITSSKFDVLGLGDSHNTTVKLPELYAIENGDFYLTKTEPEKYIQLYYDRENNNPVTVEIEINFYTPKTDDNNSFGYVTSFAAIKPKKLVCTQNRNFVYVDDTDEIHNKFVNAYSSIDLCDFAISDYTKLGTESDFNELIDEYSSFIPFDEELTLYNNCGTSLSTCGFIFYND